MSCSYATFDAIWRQVKGRGSTSQEIFCDVLNPHWKPEGHKINFEYVKAALSKLFCWIVCPTLEEQATMDGEFANFKWQSYIEGADSYNEDRNMFMKGTKLKRNLS